MSADSGKIYRFTSVMATAGKPEIYLPLVDPKKDKVFMRAVHEHRVLSVKQEPTSNRSDFGVVGFDETKHVTYFIFPKSLKEFRRARIVGIKYDAVKSAPVSMTRNALTPFRTVARVARAKELKGAPKKRVAPQPQHPRPKKYSVSLQITTTSQKELAVSALTKEQARSAAIEMAGAEPHVKIKVLSVREQD